MGIRLVADTTIVCNPSEKKITVAQSELRFYLPLLLLFFVLSACSCAW